MGHDIDCQNTLNDIMVIGMLLAGEILNLTWKSVVDSAHSDVLNLNILRFEDNQMIPANTCHLLGFVDLGLEICALFRSCVCN